ncbi:MAG TPA: RNA 2'-phosphotransferase [Rhodanobacteraceae bacterium]|nr:RNA 2'-phosphotransferase [Rhodanobacteraceae bacterium]
MSKSSLVKLSRLLSLMLRHEPEKFALVLDAEGFTPLEDVVRAAHTTLGPVTEADVIQVVETIEPDKRRFSVVDGEIRANYGHSLTTRVTHAQAEPPELLFHGTHEAAVPIVLREGLAPMKRQYVHLTDNLELAARVGARRGRSVLIEVTAGAAHRDGIKFYRANQSFWLADRVPAKYLSRK